MRGATLLRWGATLALITGCAALFTDDPTPDY